MNAKALNILMVDDEWPDAASIKVVLKDMGCVVDELHDGEVALARLTEWPGHYHILIVDNSMKRISGLELLEQLNGKPFKGKVIVMSGYLTLELDVKYRSLGADKIIRKPFELAELCRAVEELRPLAAT